MNVGIFNPTNQEQDAVFKTHQVVVEFLDKVDTKVLAGVQHDSFIVSILGMFKYLMVMGWTCCSALRTICERKFFVPKDALFTPKMEFWLKPWVHLLVMTIERGHPDYGYPVIPDGPPLVLFAHICRRLTKYFQKLDHQLMNIRTPLGQNVSEDVLAAQRTVTTFLTTIKEVLSSLCNIGLATDGSDANTYMDMDSVVGSDYTRHFRG